jgi:hypothetical protein
VADAAWLNDIAINACAGRSTEFPEIDHVLLRDRTQNTAVARPIAPAQWGLAMLAVCTTWSPMARSIGAPSRRRSAVQQPD